MEGLILGLVQKFPILAGVLMVIGVLRIINKPLFSFLRTYVQATPSPKDDLLLDDVEKSKVYEWVSYALDWMGSIKLPPQS